MSLAFDTPEALKAHYANNRRRIETATAKLKPASNVREIRVRPFVPNQPLAVLAFVEKLHLRREESRPTSRGPDANAHVRSRLLWILKLPDEPKPELYPSHKKIIKAVSDATGIPPLDILSDRRSHDITHARSVAAYLCRKLTPLSFPEIGRRLQRDHSTILYSVRKINRLRLDRPVSALIARVCDTLGVEVPA